MKILTQFLDKDELFDNSFGAKNADEWVDLEIERLNENGCRAVKRERNGQIAIYIPSDCR